MSEDTPRRVRLKRLEVHNYQAIEVAIFDVLPGVNDIAGRPAQGKSTIPQAIRELFTKGGISSMPLRRGAAEGAIRAELTDGSVVEKKITSKGAQPTRRTDAEGKRTGIDALQGWISEDVFNPLAFAALADSKPGRRTQAEIISELAGLDTSKLDDERAKHMADESAAKKAADELEAQARGVTVPPPPAEVPEEIDLAEVASRKGELEKQRAEVERRRAEAKQAATRAAEAEAEVARIHAEIEALTVKHKQAREQADLLLDIAEKARLRTVGLLEPDGSALDEEIARAKQHNANVKAAREAAAEHKRRSEERDKMLARAKAKRDEERIAGMKKRNADAAKTEAIANAAQRMPIPGLTIEGSGADREVYLNGVPLSQASTMQRMQLGCAIGLARNPRLGFLWIDYGNELDEEALSWLQGFLETNEADAFVVHVVLDGSKINEADGLIVDGGKVVADRRKTRKPRSAAASERALAEVVAEAQQEPPTQEAASSSSTSSVDGEMPEF